MNWIHFVLGFGAGWAAFAIVAFVLGALGDRVERRELQREDQWRIAHRGLR